MCSCKIFSRFNLTTLLQTEKWYLKTLCQVATEVKPKEKRKTNKTHQKELNAYLSSSLHLLKIKDQLPARCLKRNRKIPDDLYLVDSKIGAKIANLILPDIKKNNGIVVETNPGFGFVTKQLLKADVPKIHVYEPTVMFRDHLFKIDQQYPNRIKIFNKDFFSIWKLSYQDRYDNGERVKNMLSGIPQKDWNDEVAMNIIGILPNANFIRHLMLSLIFQYGIMTYGRCDLYICLPPFLYLQWAAKPEDGFQIYRASSVLLQMFCDFQIIEKLPRQVFLPWDSMIETKLANKKRFPHYTIDPDYMYLTKISFKPLPIPQDKLQALWFFVRHLMVSRKNRVIPMLEKWIPGCGWNLITDNPDNHLDTYNNINIYTRIGDMSPQQILHLFRTFLNWPEYSESPFLASMEAALLKMEQSSEESLDPNVKEVDNQEQEQEVETKEEIIER